MVDLKAGVVRILDQNSTTVGTGFLVTDDGLIATCAHVVEAALGLAEGKLRIPQGELKLDFPLLAPGHILTCRATHWQPERDVAGLYLVDTPPNDAQPVPLITTDDLWGHAFRAFGFPAGYDDGVWASGVLRGRQAAGWVQIEDVKEPGYWVQPGFSGTAVWDEQLNGVVGMAVAADTDRVTKAAFMIPAHELIEAWPELAEHSLEAGSLGHLQMQLARLEEAQHRAVDPDRFQPQIDALRERIAAWDGRIERQRERIAEGLEAQRRQRAQEQARRHEEKGLRVVGQPPLDVADYFKDRQRDLQKLGQLLAEPTTRLISVIGHSGMGKTALACKVLQDLERHRWPSLDDQAGAGLPTVPLDGIVYLSTRTAGISLERLSLDCAKLLGGERQERLNAVWTNPQIGTEEKVARLLEALSEGRYVILLDNLEDLLDEQGKLSDDDLRLFFDQALTTTCGAQLLVTSRASLAFRREVMRFDRQVKLLEGLPVEDGVTLLRELDPNGDYGLHDAPEEQLAEAVELAHGVPRALEVLADILANDPFATLDEVMETFYEQEDVVQALIEENYKRLDRDARRVVEALAVFKKPVPPLAVDYLLEPFVPGVDVPNIVHRLTRTNVVSVDRAAKTVTLHPIDQDYTYSQLPEQGTSEPAYTRQVLERRAADYYIQLRTPPDTWKTIDDLEPQLAEFEHRVRAGDYDDAYRALDPIDKDYLFLWGHYARLTEMREKLLERLRDAGLRVSNLGSLGLAYHGLGQIKKAIGYYERAVDTACKIGDRRSEGIWLGNLGSAYRDLGQVKRAITFYEQALSIARETDDRRREGVWIGDLGTAYHLRGQYEKAIRQYEQARDIYREIDDRQSEGVELGNLGHAHRALGHSGQAISFYEQALAVAREIRDRPMEGVQLGRLGVVYRDLGEFEHAVEFQEEALAVAREIGNRREEGFQLGNLGRIYLALGQIEKAIDFYEQDLEITREVGDRRGEGAVLSNLGDAHRVLGHIQQATRFYEEALFVARKTDDRRGEASELGNLGDVYRDLGQVRRAVEFHEDALEVAREICYPRYESTQLGRLGVVYFDLGQVNRAIELHEKALIIAREVGYRRGESRHLSRLGRTLLTAKLLSGANQRCRESLTLDIPEASYHAALTLGIVLLHQRNPAAVNTFANAAVRCRTMLEKTAGLYAPRYALAAALVGQAVCAPRWADESRRPDLLAPALAEYRRALAITAAPGIVQDALRDLEMIRAAGIEGLEPVFELLENAEYEPDLPEDLPDNLAEI